jgi:N-acetylmuramoyl-L-alanine amidase
VTYLRIVPILLFSLLAWSQTPKPVPRLKVAVDPGHGGEDCGARSRKRGEALQESDVVLALGKALKERLGAAGLDVVMTRDDDTFVPLWDRAKKANEAGANLFVSLHLNSARARAAKGSEVYFLSLGGASGETADLAALENSSAGSAPTSDNVLTSILQDMAQEAYLRDSERLAVSIQVELNRLGGIKERGVKQAPFVVLRGAAMPAVLVEAVFLSNPKEQAKLKDPAFLGKVADAITRGIRRYLAAGAASTTRRAPEAAPVTAS